MATRRAGSVVVAFAVIVVMLGSAAWAQSVAWIQQAVSGPSARYDHAMAYDAARGVTVLFGGVAVGSLLSGETWEWDGTAWNPQAVAGPLPRYAHAMAYDAARGVTVLFGGYTGSGASGAFNGETWEWNGAAWNQRAAGGPTARFEPAMAYDSGRGVTVLFGGVDAHGFNGETWEWNGTVWTQRAVPGPSPRDYHKMAYDAARGVTVLFGGYEGGQVYDGDTWEWDGTAWTQQATTGPLPRWEHAMAYDTARGVTVLFGGYQGGSVYDGDTWKWDGTVWTQQAITGPSPRCQHTLVYDSARGVTVMFGGYDASGYEGDTWVGLPDSDGDGIPDDWEINGVPYTDIFGVPQRYQLVGADPLRKDIYVEVDAMDGRGPSQQTIDRVVAAFAQAPVPGVPGGPNIGIALHVLLDVDEQHLQLQNGGDYTNGVNGFDDFATDKASHFGTPGERLDPSSAQMKEAKRKVFRYCIFANTYSGTSSSGVAKGIPSSDFMVTLGAVANGLPVFPDESGRPGGSQDARAGTFMHELGHTLGLRHGGGQANSQLATVNGATVDLADINWRPNYYSIMNYWWQLPDPGWQDAGSWGLRYSESALPTLDENSLSEADGIGATVNGSHVPYRVAPTSTCAGTLCYSGTGVCFSLASMSTGAPVDWDGNCLPTVGTVMADINDFSGLLPASASPSDQVLYGLGRTVLAGHNDWANLQYDFRGSSTFAQGAPAEPLLCNYDSAVLQFLGSIRRTCSADFNNDGDSGTDADIEAFFACLAGNCCATCGSADFNGDGDVGTDADIEAFFRVLAGGSC